MRVPHSISRVDAETFKHIQGIAEEFDKGTRDEFLRGKGPPAWRAVDFVAYLAPSIVGTPEHAAVTEAISDNSKHAILTKLELTG